MQYRALYTFFLIIFVFAFAKAQTITVVSGAVNDEVGAPVFGANVFLAGSYDGTSTLEDGRFLFSTTLNGAQTLRVTYLGYQDYEKMLNLTGDSIEVEVRLSAGATELEHIVITAGAFEASGEKRQEVLKPLDIVSTAGATADLAGVFNTLPGTQVVGEEGRLFVRGGEGYETKTFIDGMQVLDFYSPAAPNTPSRSRFLPFMFSGTSFSTGGYSAEYGQALSSALVLTSKPVATQSRLDISLMSVGADVGFTKAWEASSLSGKVQYTNIDPYFSLIDQDIDWVNPPASCEGSFAYRKNLGGSGIFKLYGNGNYSDFQLNQHPIDRPGRSVLTDIRNTYAYVNTTIHDELGKDWLLRAGGALTYSRDQTGVDQDELDQSETGLHGKVTLQKSVTDEVDLKFGSEYFWTDYRQEYWDAEPALRAPAGFTSHLSAVFAESDIRLSRKLLARVGLRSEYASLPRQWGLAPRISLAYKTGTNSQVSAAFGNYQQAPLARHRLAAPRLEHERATHYILNYQLMQAGRTFRVEAYHKDYDNLVKYGPGKPHTPQTFSNKGSGFARGLDLFWRDNRTIRGVDYWLSYSYLDTRRNYRDFPEAAVPSFASRHNLSIVCKQFIAAIKSQLGATFRYASGRPYHDPNLPGFQNQKTSSYQDLSLNISYLLSRNVILHASATNVLGRDIVFGYEFADAPGEEGRYASRAIRPPARRFLFLGLFITFSKDQIFNQLPNL